MINQIFNIRQFKIFTISSLTNGLSSISNLLMLLDTFKVARYLSYIPGCPHKMDSFFDSLSKYAKMTKFIGYGLVIIDDITVHKKTSCFELALLTFVCDVLGSVVSHNLGLLIGGVIGGPIGAIAVGIITIGGDILLQYYKEDFCNWANKKIPKFMS